MLHRNGILLMVALWSLLGLGCPNKPTAVVKIEESRSEKDKPNPTVAVKPLPENLSFALWNIENFFDDVDDPNNDDDLENIFGNDPYLFQRKIEQCSEVILSMNEGKGPDILVLVEVESQKALETLKTYLNQQISLQQQANPYETILFRHDNGGRRFAPAILTRLPAIQDRTQKLGERGLTRMLEGHLQLNGHELVVLAAHFTSRVTDDKGDKRCFYSDYLYGRYRAILTANLLADVIVCGDFNDEFQDRSMQKHLNAKDDDQYVIQNLNPPSMYCLTAKLGNRSNPPGTIFGRGKWSIFDHICISPGLLDGKGWTCDTKQTKIFSLPKMLDKNGRPIGFEEKRTKTTKISVGSGYSDHLPVITQVRVQKSTAKSGDR